MTDPEEALKNLTPDTAWKSFAPRASNPWDETKVAHLYRRACFGASWSTIQEGVQESPTKLIDRIVAGDDSERAREFGRDIDRLLRSLMDTGGQQEAKALWLYRMLNSPHPLRERMTLFWHDHFATSNAKVRNFHLMQNQNETLRRHALGHFDALLQDMTRDPAMIVWLDSNTNRRGTPNENYAREVMELFSLGIGHYTERDIQEAARALTGWDVRRGEAVFSPEQHDAGEKTVLGQTGRWGAGDVVRICLSQEACALYLVRKLFRALVSDTLSPSDELLRPLADEFRIRDYDIRWVVDRILRSELFYSPVALQQKVKAPCDFLIGLLKSLEGQASMTKTAGACDQLGQSLFNPPSVKGWEGGPAWVNSTTLLQRQNLAFQMTRGGSPAALTDPARLVQKYGVSGIEPIATFFLRLFHQQVDPAALASITAQLTIDRDAAAGATYSQAAEDAVLARAAAHLALTMPEYQVG